MSRRQSSSRVYRLGIIADLHCLSRYALVPPRFRPAQPLPSAMFHDWLWECWLDFCRKCPPLDSLIVNGDTIEGESPSKRDAMDALTDDLNLQVDAAVENGGPGHPVGEGIYKLVRYSKKRNPEDLAKLAAWAFLMWRHHK